MTPPKINRDILVVDDEAQIRSVLRSTLESEGYTVREAENGRTALGEAALKRPDAIVLDLGLPDRGGLEILKALRLFCAAPVLILTVADKEQVKIETLDLGADDFMTKPFGDRELLARLRALLRRTSSAPISNRLKFGPIEVDLTQRLVQRDGKSIALTVTEYALLRLLVINLDKVVTHKEMLREVWGPRAESQTHYLRMYMMRLRRKLGNDISEGGYIQTESGVGYRLVSEP